MRAIKLHAGGWGEIAVIRTFFFPSFFLKGKGGGGRTQYLGKGEVLILPCTVWNLWNLQGAEDYNLNSQKYWINFKYVRKVLVVFLSLFYLEMDKYSYHRGKPQSHLHWGLCCIVFTS